MVPVFHLWPVPCPRPESTPARAAPSPRQRLEETFSGKFDNIRPERIPEGLTGGVDSWCRLVVRHASIQKLWTGDDGFHQVAESIAVGCQSGPHDVEGDVVGEQQRSTQGIR